MYAGTEGLVSLDEKKQPAAFQHPTELKATNVISVLLLILTTSKH